MIFKNVKKEMIDQDLTNKNLAKILGYRTSHICGVITGRIHSIKVRKSIALALGKDYDFLWDEKKTRR
ncbi:hypothetical protein [Desulfobacula sp.]|uniref:hypothetical protein n=1 Tax=Desulfobacula sp. TaxID=2593537 RepID=UPI0025BBCD82|nr:hypothetical protein [Desulfobacula sp.]MBC2703978.1 hypothetical protein [Desulfobacula sp.]